MIIHYELYYITTNFLHFKCLYVYNVSLIVYKILRKKMVTIIVLQVLVLTSRYI